LFTVSASISSTVSASISSFLKMSINVRKKILHNYSQTFLFDCSRRRLVSKTRKKQILKASEISLITTRKSKVYRLNSFLSNLIDWRKNELLTAVCLIYVRNPPHYIEILSLQSHLLISHLMIHRDSFENRDLRSSRDFFLLIKMSSSFVVTSIWFHQNRILIFELFDFSTISKINRYERNHLDLNKSSRLNDRRTTRREVNKLMKNRRYESSSINKCDSKSNRSCMKNAMIM
jgi:hypothetical protein